MPRLTRDGAILTAALAWGTFEIVYGGARSAVLTLVGTLLVTPVALRLDDARRSKTGGAQPKEDLNE